MQNGRVRTYSVSLTHWRCWRKQCMYKPQPHLFSSRGVARVSYSDRTGGDAILGIGNREGVTKGSTTNNPSRVLLMKPLHPIPGGWRFSCEIGTFVKHGEKPNMIVYMPEPCLTWQRWLSILDDSEMTNPTRFYVNDSAAKCS